MAERNKRIKRFRRKGWTYGELVEYFGISQSRIVAVLNDPNSHKVVRKPTTEARAIPKPPARHGSDYAYRRHLLRHEPPCTRCSRAHAAAQRAYQARKASA